MQQIKKEKIKDLLKILKKIRKEYENGYFVYEFDKLLKEEKVDKIDNFVLLLV